jgi:hypothetical protein
MFDEVLYDWIHNDQIMWFEKYPILGDLGLMFFHIPFPEYHDPRLKIIKGVKNEKPCAPKENSGLFASITRKQNRKVKKSHIKAVFVGHDHLVRCPLPIHS